MEEKDQITVKHRLKHKDLVKYVFFIFSDKYEKSDAETIWDIKIPLERLRNLLKERYKANYTSNSYIYTQLKRYEEEIGSKLFRFEKEPGSDQYSLISIHNKMSAFYQHHHLYATHKIKIANGVYGMIQNFTSKSDLKRPVNILLGSGTIPYHLAIILAEKSREEKTKYCIYTHNLGVIEELRSPKVDSEYIDVYISAGRIDPWVNAVLGTDNNLYKSTDFDFIVQSVKYVYDGKVYVNSQEESKRKGIILKECKGLKILTLIKDELVDQPLKGLTPFGALTDYNYLVVPRMMSSTGKKRKYDLIFDQYQDLFSPEIIHWNYIIYKVITASKK